MNEYVLIQTVEGLIGGRYRSWTIGITEAPDQRRVEHGNPRGWNHWHADDEATARSVERYFVAKGCNRGTDGGDHPTYVYVF